MSPMVAAWIGLIAYAVGVVVTFGVRSWLQWRATGSTGYRGISGRPGSLPWWGGVLFALALVLAGLAPLLAITSTIGPFLQHPALSWAGAVVTLAGFALTLLAQRGMGETWRVGVDDTESIRLVQTGVFAFVRNPVFTAMVVALAGMTLLVPSVIAVGALACLVAAVNIQVRVIEEPYLLRVHGESYRIYRARTGRFVPRFATASTDRQHPDGS